MDFDQWMLTVAPKHKPTDDGVTLRVLRQCWEAARAAERERWLMLCEQALAALVWEAGSEPALYAAQTSAAISALRGKLGPCVYGRA